MKTLSIVIATAFLSFGLAGSMNQNGLGASAPHLASQYSPALQPGINATQPPASHNPVMLALHCNNPSNPDCD